MKSLLEYKIDRLFNIYLQEGIGQNVIKVAKELKDVIFSKKLLGDSQNIKDFALGSGTIAAGGKLIHDYSKPYSQEDYENSLTPAQKEAAIKLMQQLGTPTKK